MWAISRSSSEKRRLCGSPAAVTRRRGAGWRWGACQGASSSGKNCQSMALNTSIIKV
ncbi:unnamed protein product [Spirodela intermedia]|uniref:Uncharacterized protein n=1 Tax=Spirodela intermedia TaxID=51605 RepID=A0ABN7E8X3_SPIIN|nr:unnamed protein product [Spirodela intermedia]